MLDLLGLDKKILPHVLPSDDVYGKINPQIAAELGLSTETLVIAGGADNSCAAIGNGVTRMGQAVISIGTSGTVVAMLDSAPKTITGRVHIFNYSFPDRLYAMGCMLCAGESLSWLSDLLNIGYDELNTLAEAAPAGADGLIFLPYLFGERCPVANPNARGIFFGLNRQHGAAHMARAVMEGVAHNIRAMLDEVAEIAEINEFYITGGGAKSPIWGQIIADIIGHEIAVLNIEEGPAFGAALIAAVGAQLYPDFDTAKADFLKVARRITPANQGFYDKPHEHFRNIYKANAPLM